jgi:hypothetical protein
MRWLVDVTALGSTEKDSLLVEADSCQGALQVARSKRGETDGMAGFSIDLLNEGCRAVDPGSRVSYDVRRAPEGSPGSLRPPASVPRPQPPTASKIVFKREQDRTRALPLTYREYVYIAPSGTTEAAAEALLRGQLERIRTSLANLPAGKLVNLAVFDRPFEGKPTVPPVATLEWKDWRDAETVTFPRQAAEHVAPTVPPAPAPAIASVVVVQRDPFATPEVATSSTSTAPPPPAAPPSQPRRGSTPRLRAPGARVRGEDLIADLFEAMSDLHFLRDAIEAGDFCLAQVMERLPCQAGLVHLYDIDRREFVITNGQGSGANALLLRRHPESEPMLSKAMRGRNSLVIGTAESITSPIDRYQSLGGPRSVIVAPVMQAGRFLGAIELLNPTDGQPFTQVEGNAVMYVAEQLAEYVATHGVVTDPDRIGTRRSG